MNIMSMLQYCCIDIFCILMTNFYPIIFVRKVTKLLLLLTLIIFFFKQDEHKQSNKRHLLFVPKFHVKFLSL